MRPIDADVLKDKLQQHHDFYVMAWGGFGKMPISEKKRVDEITNCIVEILMIFERIYKLTKLYTFFA